MIRPSHKELYGKIRQAKKTVAEGKVLIVEQEAVAADALELEYLIETELLDVLQELLEETNPVHYAGTRPPQRSYEREIEGLELFAFGVESNRFKCRVYYKFALAQEFFWLVPYIKIEAIRRPHDSRKVPKRAWNYGFEKN